MCLQIEKIVINQSKKKSQQNENKKVLTKRKKVSYDRNKNFGLMCLICSENSQPIENIFFRSDDTFFRSPDTSTRWHFDSKTLLPENISTRWVSTSKLKVTAWCINIVHCLYFYDNAILDCLTAFEGIIRFPRANLISEAQET